MKDINEIIEEYKSRAKKLQEEGKLAGFFWKPNLIVGIWVKGEAFYDVVYKCPNCGYIGVIKIDAKPKTVDIICEKCGALVWKKIRPFRTRRR